MIYCILGRSASGKDSVYNKVITQVNWLKPYVMYTTRPMRAGEIEGETYHFITNEELNKMKLIHNHTFHTVDGDWNYAIADDINESGDVLLVTNTYAYEDLLNFYGADLVKAIMLEAPTKCELLIRAIRREYEQPHPNYEEVCRRFLDESKVHDQFYKDHPNIPIVLNYNLDLCVERVINLLMSYENQKEIKEIDEQTLLLCNKYDRKKD